MKDHKKLRYYFGKNHDIKLYNSASSFVISVFISFNLSSFQKNLNLSNYTLKIPPIRNFMIFIIFIIMNQ